MPRRKNPLVTNEIYHIVNRTIGGYPIFNTNRNCKRFINLLRYYLVENPPVRYSKYLLLKDEDRKYIDNAIQTLPKKIDILCFCLMPNHFHLLLKQLTDQSLKNYIMKISNSLSHYINLKRNRKGPLFQSRFRSVLIEDIEQLIHVSRYIHLNPYSSNIVKSKKELLSYPYSSLNEYIQNPLFCKTNIISKHFKEKLDYKKFIFNHVDHQKSLQKFKHLYIN